MQSWKNALFSMVYKRFEALIKYPQINVPVHVGGVTIHPGDLLHGDRNGVTRIPIEIASAVAHACSEYMAAEAVVLDYLKTDGIDAKGYARARNECRERIEALARRLRR